MQYFADKGVGELVRTTTCWNKTGKAPVTVRWIDHDKGDVYRSRLVARQFRGEEEAIFAATPPLEVLKLILSLAVTDNEPGRIGGRKKVGGA